MNILEHRLSKIIELDKDKMNKTKSRVDNLIKPKESLGKLEDILIKLSGIQRTCYPKVDKKAIIVCAGDHKIIEEGVATSKKDITLIQALNMTRGLTGVCALSKQSGAEVVVVDVGIDNEVENSAVINKKVKYGADNFRYKPAMTREEAIQSIEAGIEVAEMKIKEGINLLGTGEMGIGNTTPSSAILSVIGEFDPMEVTGIGANLPLEKVKHKATVIREAIENNKPNKDDPIDVLSKVGGLEIGAMAGVMIAGAANNTPVVIDGFISSAAALLAITIEPKVKDYLFASHNSMEAGAKKMTEVLDITTYLDMNMRLGEGTGAALMFHIIEAATYMNNEMITFDEAGFIVK